MADTTYQSHIFVARTIPDPYEIHCLFAHLTDKSYIPSKVTRNGRVISVICQQNAIAPVSVSIDTNAFDYRRTEPVGVFTANAGDIATISVHLCYTIKRRSPGGKLKTIAPIDPLGKIKPAERKHFLSYLESQTGLTGLVAGAAELTIVIDPIADAEQKKRKVWFVGAAEVILRATVRDASTFNRLATVAIGNRRSYGFGAVSCDLLEAGSFTSERKPLLD